MATDRKQIVGIEISEGVSKKTGNAYSIGTLHTMTQLAPATGGNVSIGFMGDKYACDVIILRKLQHLRFPIFADVITQDAMRFGNRVTYVTDVQPVGTDKKTA